MPKILLLLLFVSALAVKAQDKTVNNWHFGHYCGITFNTNPPSALTNSSLSTIEGSASISDSAGNLLLYTDGRFVYTKNNTVMPNGAGLSGHLSSTQSALIVPLPKSNFIYYIFTTDADAGLSGGVNCGGCLSYSIVDMSLNGGLGDVIVKNKFLFARSTEKLAGTYYRNGNNFWVLAHEYNSNNFLTFKLDSSGIDTVPVVSTTGQGHTYSNSFGNARGQMKISPDGAKVAYCLEFDGFIELFDFNNATGQVGNPITITSKRNAYGLEFSPDSKLLYVSRISSNTELMQFNLINWNLTNIQNSEKIIATGGYEIGQLQLAPDGKIYTARYHGSLFVINNPDVPGTGCNYAYSGITLPTSGTYGPSVCKLGLPNFVSGFYKTTYVPPTDLVVDSSDIFCSEIEIPNVITPNGDGINDSFKIFCKGVYYFPEGLILYNRWGNEVHFKDIQDLSHLNDGIYFFTFTYHDKNYKGFVSIFR